MNSLRTGTLRLHRQGSVSIAVGTVAVLLIIGWAFEKERQSETKTAMNNFMMINKWISLSIVDGFECWIIYYKSKQLGPNISDEKVSRSIHLNTKQQEWTTNEMRE